MAGKVWPEIILVAKAVGYIAFIVCYYVGLGLLVAARELVYVLTLLLGGRASRGQRAKTLRSFSFDADQSRQWRRWFVISRSKLGKLSNREFRLALVVFIFLIGLTVGGLQSVQLVGRAWDIRDRLAGSAQRGLGQLSAAEKLLKDQSVDLAGVRFAEAISSFDQTQRDLKAVGGIMNGLLNVLPQKRDGEELIKAVRTLGQAGLDLTRFYQDWESLHLGAQGLSAPGGAEKTLTALNASLAQALNNVRQAEENLARVNESSVPGDQRLIFAQAKNQVAAARTGLATLSEVIKIVATLSSGHKTILLLSQNNNELRATGGFIGTYGDISLSNGAIGNMKIESIYALDGQLKESITPPRPLWAVNNRWYMRDSNWFFDFPTSVKKIISFYEKEGGETPDLVIAITPTVMVDLLKITGPVNLSKYNVTLTAENFVELTQLETSVNYDKVENQPKQMLADFTPALLERLNSLSADQWLLVFETLQRNLAAKHIMFYSRDPGVQAQFAAFNWNGEVRATDRDYLAVVNSNLGGTKTDLAIEQKISLDSVIDHSGAIVNTLTVTRINPLPAQPGLENLSFMRIYVPKGAALISTQGFSSMPLPDRLGEDQQTDPDVYALENGSVRHVLSNTLISEENGNTVFGNWVKVAGQASQTVTITYRLPFELNQLDHHSLLLQKQPGAVNQSFSYKVEFLPRAIAWKNFDAEVSGGALTLPALEFNRDYFFGLVFDRPEENQ